MDLPLAFPSTSYLRLRLVASITGTPESTMRDACKKGDMDHRFQAGAYYARLVDHDAWVCRGDPPEPFAPIVPKALAASPPAKKVKRTPPGGRKIVHVDG